MVKIKIFLKFFVKQLLKKIYRYDFFKKALCTEQSQILASILVEQKAGILAVFCTPPVRAQNTENAAKRKKIRTKNVSRETFLLQTADTCLSQRAIKSDDWANRPPILTIFV